MAGTLVANTINTDTGLFSTNNAYLGMAKAWVNYNQTTRTIANSFNVSSVTYNGTGDFSINFATAMPNANYVAAGMTNINLWVQYGWNGASGTAPSTTSLRVQTEAYNAALYDGITASVVIFGN